MSNSLAFFGQKSPCVNVTYHQRMGHDHHISVTMHVFCNFHFCSEEILVVPPLPILGTTSLCKRAKGLNFQHFSFVTSDLSTQNGPRISSLSRREDNAVSLLGDENSTQTFFLKLFGHPKNIPGISRQKVWLPWVSRDMLNCSAPTHSRGRPPLHPKISGPKSLGLASLFLPDLLHLHAGAPWRAIAAVR